MRNRLISLSKWPVATVAVFFSWFALNQFLVEGYTLVKSIKLSLPLIGGMGLYGVLWKFWLSKSPTFVWLIVFEHEVTHAVASLATFNGVHRMHVDSSGTGHISAPNSTNLLTPTEN
jgi:hypothetical protein